MFLLMLTLLECYQLFISHLSLLILFQVLISEYLLQVRFQGDPFEASSSKLNVQEG